MSKRFPARIAAVFAFFVLLSPVRVYASELPDAIWMTVWQHNRDEAQARWIADAICYASSIYGVDPILITAVMESESGFNFAAISNKGAIGLMQLMPETAQMIGVDPYDPLSNILGGASHLRALLANYADMGEYAATYAVAAYNAGSNAVDTIGCPPYEETREYIVNVAEAYQRILSLCN